MIPSKTKGVTEGGTFLGYVEPICVPGADSGRQGDLEETCTCSRVICVGRSGSVQHPWREDLRIPGTNWHGGRDLPVATGASCEPGQASVLRELEGAGLHVIERSFDPGETIYAPGDPDARLYFLIGGA